MAYKFNPFTGTLDIVGTGGSSSADNFSYDEVHTPITIPEYQQMAVFGSIIIEDELIIEGTLVLEV